MPSTLCLICILQSVQLQLTSNRVRTETSAGCCVTLNSNSMSGFLASRPSCLINFSKAGIANSSRKRDSPPCPHVDAIAAEIQAHSDVYLRDCGHFWEEVGSSGATGFYRWCLAVKKFRLSKLWTLVGGRSLRDWTTPLLHSQALAL